MNYAMSNTDNNFLGELDIFDNVSPIKSSPPQGAKEHRNEIRYRAAWRIFVAIEGHNLHDGRIRDISIHGTAILNVRNLKPGTSVTLHIHIPPLNGPGTPRILIAHGKTSYSIHDVDNQCFRVGVTFVKFELASDRAYLEARLTNHHSKAL